MKRKIIIISISLLLFLFSIIFIYINDYYKADYNSINTFLSDNKINYDNDNNKNNMFFYSNSDIGFIFYPGGKVESSAYIPLLLSLNEYNINTFLVDMPFNLAIFDINAADKIIKNNKQIKKWYIGGHSLGGAMAASYVENNSNNIRGLILLGSYSSVDLSNKNIKVLSIYGNQDKILNKRNYNKYKNNLPKNFSEKIIKGGCHSYFGMYGLQDGDGTPNITNKEQINITVDLIVNYLNS